MAFDISYIIQAVDQFSPHVKKMQDSLKNFDRSVGKVSSHLKNFSERTSKLGRNISLKLGAPLAAAATMAVRTSFDFQKSMNMVEAVTHTTTERMKEMHDMAIRLGRTTQFTARDAARAMSFFGLSGMSATEVIKAMPGALGVAASAQLTMNDTTQLLTDSLNLFNLPLSKLPLMADTMVNAFTKANMRIMELHDAYIMVGAQASLAGLSLKDTTAAIMTLAKAGLRGPKAGRNLARALQHMIAPTPKATALLKQLGFSFVDAEGKLKSLHTIVEKFAALQRRHIIKPAGMEVLFGEIGIRAFHDLIKFGVGTFDNYKRKLEEVGTSGRTARTQMKRLPGAIYELQAALEHVQIVTIEANETFVEKFLRSLRKMILYFADTNPATKRFVLEMSAFAMALGPALIGLAKFLIILRLATGLPFLSLLSGGIYVAAILALAIAFIYLYKHSKIFRNVIKAIGHAAAWLGKRMYADVIEPWIKAFEYAKKFYDFLAGRRGGAGADLSQIIVSRRTPAETGAGLRFAPTPPMSLEQSVRSMLNINVNDPGGVVKNMTGESDSDFFEMSTGLNMAGAR